MTMTQFSESINMPGTYALHVTCDHSDVPMISQICDDTYSSYLLFLNINDTVHYLTNIDDIRTHCNDTAVEVHIGESFLGLPLIRGCLAQFDLIGLNYENGALHDNVIHLLVKYTRATLITICNDTHTCISIVDTIPMYIPEVAKLNITPEVVGVNVEESPKRTVKLIYREIADNNKSNGSALKKYLTYHNIDVLDESTNIVDVFSDTNRLAFYDNSTDLSNAYYQKISAILGKIAVSLGYSNLLDCDKYQASKRLQKDSAKERISSQLVPHYTHFIKYLLDNNVNQTDHHLFATALVGYISGRHELLELKYMQTYDPNMPGNCVYFDDEFVYISILEHKTDSNFDIKVKLPRDTYIAETIAVYCRLGFKQESTEVLKASLKAKLLSYLNVLGHHSDIPDPVLYLRHMRISSYAHGISDKVQLAKLARINGHTLDTLLDVYVQQLYPEAQAVPLYTLPIRAILDQ